MEKYYPGQTLYGTKNGSVVQVKLIAIDSFGIIISSNGKEYRFDSSILGISLFVSRYDLFGFKASNKSKIKSSALIELDEQKQKDSDDFEKKLQNMRESPPYDKSQHKKHNGPGQLLSEKQMNNWPEEMGFRRPDKKR